ncbi:sensory box sensor histidine kinase in two-component regulatory system [Catenovulum agarivorans DS-2]|uniref:histidine kinase n=1 Tax=Catenovulum agarivorans DS-2 TaxID=1328313 RepID=W7QL90_9ALTE|nr:HAMP domain-containing sensor histidine kinase [Catenovulum agarivorans]EWH09687.1 sensory box sensor histidine kinase in two-component regulatory system [Catenovulum agarivorans DS-2]
MATAATEHQHLAREAYAGELAALRSQADQFVHLIDVIPAGVVILNAQGNVERSNQIAIDLLGEPLDGQKWLTVIARAFNPQADDGHEVSLQDGRRVRLETNALSSESGQLILLTDMTQTRLLQARVSQMKQLSSLGRMVASLAHQIRTPLSAAMLYAANLANPSLVQAAKQTFQQKLMGRLKDLESQINDMLLFAKSGHQQVAEAVSLGQLLSEVHAGSEAMVAQNGAELDLQLPDPDIHIFGNKVALASAIQNLIHNSVQIIGAGAQISISAKMSNNSHDQVEIVVADNGPGIEKQHIPHVFEPFFTTRTKGTGLGLAVVKTVVEQHQGQILIDSQQPGCCIVMRFPCAQQLAVAVGQN